MNKRGNAGGGSGDAVPTGSDDNYNIANAAGHITRSGYTTEELAKRAATVGREAIARDHDADNPDYAKAIRQGKHDGQLSVKHAIRLARVVVDLFFTNSAG